VSNALAYYNAELILAAGKFYCAAPPAHLPEWACQQGGNEIFKALLNKYREKLARHHFDGERGRKRGREVDREKER
jgi:hypothetical protein